MSVRLPTSDVSNFDGQCFLLVPGSLWMRFTFCIRAPEQDLMGMCKRSKIKKIHGITFQQYSLYCTHLK